jgi:transcriptional regulator with XRE-family HTH domain
MTTSYSDGFTGGLGELVRAHRTYTGLSLRGFADRLGIREKSLSDIEIGRRNAPPKFMESVERVVGEFDDQVEMTIAQATKMIADSSAQQADDMVHFRVTDNPHDDFVRAVIGRAAVTSGLILPILTVETIRV